MAMQEYGKWIDLHDSTPQKQVFQIILERRVEEEILAQPPWARNPVVGSPLLYDSTQQKFVVQLQLDLAGSPLLYDSTQQKFVVQLRLDPLAEEEILPQAPWAPEPVG